MPIGDSKPLLVKLEENKVIKFKILEKELFDDKNMIIIRYSKSFKTNPSILYAYTTTKVSKVLQIYFQRYSKNQNHQSIRHTSCPVCGKTGENLDSSTRTPSGKVQRMVFHLRRVMNVPDVSVSVKVEAGSSIYTGRRTFVIIGTKM